MPGQCRSIHTSDTESIVSREGHSDCEGDQDPVPISDLPFPPVSAQRFSASFEWLASVDVESLFAKRACLMKAVPGFMKGSYRSAMRIALAEIDEGRSHQAGHSALLPRLEVVPVVAKGVAPQISRVS